METRIEARMATKESIKDMATKSYVKTEIANLKASLTWRMMLFSGIIVGMVGLMMRI